MTERAIIERAQRAIDEHVLPGCVVGAVYTDGRRLVNPLGSLTYERGAHDGRAATVYDLASVTKSVPLASLVLVFVAEGRLKLSDPAVRFLPELRNDFGATIEDLLRYRVQGVRLSTLNHNTPEEIRRYVFEHGFNAPPGESVYTNLPALVLGLIIEHIGGESLAELSRRYFFDPLGMSATTFFPKANDCAPTEINERGEVCGLPHDESAYRFALAHECAGHAGLFSTVPDLLNFLEPLLRTGDGLTKPLVEGASAGLGWHIEGNFLGHHASTGAFGKTGFTGTSVCVDPAKGVAFVILSNRTYPKRPADDSAINSFRSDIADMILGSI